MEIRKMLSMVLSAIFILSSMVVAFADTSISNVVSAPLKNKQELTISLYDDPKTLDFQASYEADELRIYSWIMEGLTRNTDNGRIKPGIAEKWEMSPDGKEWTFHLRDAKWVDGKAIIAQDFVYGWFRAIDPKKPVDYGYLFYDIVNAEEYSLGKVKKEDVGIRAVDDKTIKVMLDQPVIYFDYLVSCPVYAPVRQDVYEKYREKYNTEAEYFITNGPFKLTIWTDGASMVFEKNNDYWDAANIKLEKVTGIVVDTYQDIVSMYERGEADLIEDVSYWYRKMLPENEIRAFSDSSIWYFSFNCTDPVLKNKNIRKALTYAVDRQHFIYNVANKPWKPALAFVQPDIVPDADGKTFREKTPAFFKDNDVATAKEFLQQGMNELGLKRLPKLTLLVNDSEGSEQYGQAFKQMWKKNLGVDIEVESVPARLRLKRQSIRDYQISLAGWGLDYPDAISALDLFVTDGENNDAAYSNSQYDEYIKAAKAELDKAKRSALLHQAEQLLMDEMPIAPLFYRYSNYAVKSYVKNFKRDSFAPDIDLIYSYIEGKN